MTMPASRSAGIVFGVAAVILSHIVWFSLYRALRTDILRDRLDRVRDQLFMNAGRGSSAFSDPHWIATLAWIDAVIAGAARLTPSRFVLTSLSRWALPDWFAVRDTSPHPEVLSGVAGPSMALIRAHLIRGCPLLAFWLRSTRRMDPELLSLVLSSACVRLPRVGCAPSSVRPKS
jgi:hypothetical protein